MRSTRGATSVRTRSSARRRGAGRARHTAGGEGEDASPRAGRARHRGRGGRDIAGGEGASPRAGRARRSGRGGRVTASGGGRDRDSDSDDAHPQSSSVCSRRPGGRPVRAVVAPCPLFFAGPLPKACSRHRSAPNHPSHERGEKKANRSIDFRERGRRRSIDRSISFRSPRHRAIDRLLARTNEGGGESNRSIDLLPKAIGRSLLPRCVFLRVDRIFLFSLVPHARSHTWTQSGGKGSYGFIEPAPPHASQSASPFV